MRSQLLDAAIDGDIGSFNSMRLEFSQSIYIYIQAPILVVECR
jgi:hypothetical protein